MYVCKTIKKERKTYKQKNKTKKYAVKKSNIA